MASTLGSPELRSIIWRAFDVMLLVGIIASFLTFFVF